MKKEKQVRSYKRRTKSGKTVTVKAHTAKYEAADEKAKEVSKKPGAGKELEERKKKPIQLEIPFDKEEEKKVLDEVKETTKKESEKKPAEKKTTKKVRPVGSGTNGPIPKEKKSEGKTTKTSDSKSTSEPAFTAAEFKEWYRGTGSAADKKVAKALRAQLGRAGYRKLEDEAIDGYSSRGHLSMFKRVSGGSEVSAKTGKSANSGKTSAKAEPKPNKLTAKETPTKTDDDKSWKSQMRTKYSGQGKNAEILSLLGVTPSIRLAPSGFTKGAITTAIKELRKQNSPTSAKEIKMLEKLLEQKNKEKTSKESTASKTSKNAASGTKSAKTASETTRLVSSAIKRASKKYQRDISGLFVESILGEIPREKIKGLSPDKVWDSLYKANSSYQKKRNKYEPQYRAEHYSLDEIANALKKLSEKPKSKASTASKGTPKSLRIPPTRNSTNIEKYKGGYSGYRGSWYKTKAEAVASFKKALSGED